MNKKLYDLAEYLAPVWKTNFIRNETVMFLGEEDSAPLLSTPDGEVSVKNYFLDKTYVEGKDYKIENGVIYRLKGGDIPYIRVEDYYLTDPGKYSIGVDMDKIPYKFDSPRYLAYGEEDTFTKFQIAVSYTHKDVWKGRTPTGKKLRFRGFFDKLAAGERINVTFYGDSITTGCNSSGTDMGGNVPPYMDSFPVMMCEHLTKNLSADISYANVAVGGWDTRQGLLAFDERVLPTAPDLLILGFGMNDLHTPLDEYKDMIEEMMLRLRKQNPKAEVMLVATMWPHTESTWVLNQIRTLPKLLELEGQYPFASVADMTTMHEDILATGKRYRDMTGNNINHPNDFMARVYAQVLLATLLDE